MQLPIRLTKELAADPGDWITLNVGGTRFSTTRSTLQRDPQSMLAKMFSEEWDSARDSTGAFLIDRSPEYFEPLLNYLRSDVLVLDDGINVEGVLEEAKFFNLQGVITASCGLTDWCR